MPVALCILFPFSTLYDDMLAMLICATRWLSMHLYTLTYMSMPESCLLVCYPYFNIMKLWTFDHICSSRTLPFVCFLACLLAFSHACLRSCFFACHVYLAYLFYASFVCTLHFFPSIACLLVSCLCLCMYTHGVRTHGARAQSPMHKQKGRGCKNVGISQAAMFSSFRGLASPIWLCT